MYKRILFSLLLITGSSYGADSDERPQVGCWDRIYNTICYECNGTEGRDLLRQAIGALRAPIEPTQDNNMPISKNRATPEQMRAAIPSFKKALTHYLRPWHRAFALLHLANYQKEVGEVALAATTIQELIDDATLHRIYGHDYHSRSLELSSCIQWQLAENNKTNAAAYNTHIEQSLRCLFAIRDNKKINESSKKLAYQPNNFDYNLLNETNKKLIQKILITDKKNN